MARLQTGGRRWKHLGLGGAVLAVLSVLALLTQALALGTSTFESADGNESPDATGKIDWSSPIVVANQQLHNDKSQDAADDSISGAEDDTTVTVTAGSVQPNKSDLTQIRSYRDKGTDGKDYLYLAWNRFPTTEGVMAIDFELNQASQGTVPGDKQPWTLNRTPGDKLIVFEMVNGGTVPIISLLTWTATGPCDSPGQKRPCWGTAHVLSTTTNPAAEGMVNSPGDIVFGELAISLQDAGIFRTGACTSFASLYVKSRSSGSSLSNQISDMVAPQENSISNCGALTVSKTVVGPTLSTDASTFDFTVACVGKTLATGDASFSLASGASKVINDIPFGSVCTVTETDPGSGWSTTKSIDSGTATSGRVAVMPAMDANGEAVAYTNTRSLGGLTVSKSVSGGSGETFTFTASCTGFTLAAGDASFTLGNGGTKSITGIPTGSSCTVAETDPGAAAWNTTLVVNGTSVSGLSGSSTISGTTSTFAFTNTRLTGALTITKSVTGPANAADPTSFSFTAACTGYTLAAGDASFSLGDGGTKTINGIPTGTSCTVTETSPGSGWTTTRSIDGGAAATGTAGTITMDSNGESIAFSNVRSTAALTVTKTTSGGTGTFAFTVACTGFPLSAGDSSFSLSGGQSKVISAIPTGTSCSVTESDPGSGWSTTYTVAGGSATAGRAATTTIASGGVTVAFTNTRNTGSLTIKKTTTGGTGTFAFDIDCSDNAFDQRVQITGTGTAVISGIPTGTTCDATEVADPLFTSTRVTATGSVTITTAGQQIEFTNVRKTGSLTVSKTATGGNGTFTFTVDCTDNAFDQTVTVTTTNGAGSATINGIPTTTSCTVTETVPTGWTAVGPTTRTVTINGAETAAFANRLLTSGIDITKTPSATTVHAGDAVTYTYVVTNTGENPLSTVTVTDDKCATVTGPAAGGDADGDGKLDTTETWTYTCTSTLNATTTNVATATGVDPLDKKVSDTATATVAVIKPAIAITKTPSLRSVDPGTVVVYTYTVTNPGDVALGTVMVQDDKCSPVTFVTGDANGDGLLQTTETWIFRCSQVQTGAADTLTNVGTASGTDPLGKVVTSKDTVTIAVVAPLVLQQPAPVAVAPVAVAPVIVTLPRTGIDVRGWLQLAGSLMLLGVALLLTARRRRTA